MWQWEPALEQASAWVLAEGEWAKEWVLVLAVDWVEESPPAMDQQLQTLALARNRARIISLTRRRRRSRAVDRCRGGTGDWSW